MAGKRITRSLGVLSLMAVVAVGCGTTPAPDAGDTSSTSTTTADGPPPTDPPTEQTTTTAPGEQTHFEVLWECRQNETPPPGGGVGYTCRSNEAVRTAMFGQVDWLMQIRYELDENEEDIVALSGSASARGSIVCEWFGVIGAEFMAPVTDGVATFEYVMEGQGPCEDRDFVFAATWDLDALTLDMAGDVVPADY